VRYNQWVELMSDDEHIQEHWHAAPAPPPLPVQQQPEDAGAGAWRDAHVGLFWFRWCVTAADTEFEWDSFTPVTVTPGMCWAAALQQHLLMEAADLSADSRSVNFESVTLIV
jgi:hypothetical protein